jgi:hypothetical protein
LRENKDVLHGSTGLRDQKTRELLNSLHRDLLGVDIEGGEMPGGEIPKAGQLHDPSVSLPLPDALLLHKRARQLAELHRLLSEKSGEPEGRRQHQKQNQQRQNNG